MSKGSINGGKHPYQRGFHYWNSIGAFWRNQNYSPKSQQYFESWVKDMRDKETRLIRL